MLDLEPGDYYWCACGLSDNQPFCDGHHAATDITPIKFTIAERGKIALCRCKATDGAPRCDGSHKSLVKVAERTAEMKVDTEEK